MTYKINMRNTGLLFVVLSFLLVGCSDHIAPDFSYSPEMPKCGQTITFTNLTTGDADWEAESWNWDFGDSGTSTLQNPTHIYRKAGIYTVSLKVDSSKNAIKTRSITVYDSIPTVVANVDSVKFFQNVTFSALIYNPTGATITYSWSFSDNAKSATSVKLNVTVGDSVYNVSSTFTIYNYKAKSLLMAQKNKNILRKRIFINGMEEAVELPVSSGKHPFNIAANNDKLYIFDAGSSVQYNANWSTDTSGDGSIRVVDLKNNTATEIANNRNTSSHFGFYNGYVDNQNIYWTDFSEFVYAAPIGQTIGNFDWKGSLDAQTNNAFYKVKTDRLGYSGKGLDANQFSGGIRYFDNAYYWAKGGSGRGIYRFLPTDILAANATSTTPIPTLGAILTDYAIRAFVFDEVNAKIYFSVTAPADKIGLWVSNLNGTNPQRIEAEPVDAPELYITGIAIDNESNRLYWAFRGTKSGVKMMPLITNDLNKVNGTIEFFLPDVEVYGIAVDKVRR